MQEIIFYILCFLLVYLIYLCFVVFRKKKLNKYRTSTEVRYLEYRYHINMENINLKKMANTMALANAFIISNTVTIISFIDETLLKLAVGFVVLIPMILLVYHIVGKYYQKKYGVKKNEPKARK